MIKLTRPWVLPVGAASLVLLGFSVLKLLNKSHSSAWPIIALLSIVAGAGAVYAARKSPEPVLIVNEGSRAHRSWQTAGWAIFALFVVITPYVLDSFRVQQVNKALYFAVAVLGLNLAVGYSGLLTLGHGAFMGMGAFLTVIMIEDNGWPAWAALLLVIPVTFLAGLIVGVPALRIKGLYLALVTFALSYAFPIILKIDQWGISERTGGDLGRNISKNNQLLPGSLKGLLGISGKDASSQEQIYKYWVLALVTAICFLIVRNLVKSRAGRAIIAMKENQTGAAVSGVPITTYKVVTFGISAIFAGVGGWMYAVLLNQATPNGFGPAIAISLLLCLVLGGVYTLQGALVGSILFVFLDDIRTRVTLTSVAGWRPKFFQIASGSPLTQAVLGVVLILIAFFAPGGVVWLSRRIRATVLRVVPRVPTGDAVQTSAGDDTVSAVKAEPEAAVSH